MAEKQNLQKACETGYISEEEKSLIEEYNQRLTENGVPIIYNLRHLRKIFKIAQSEQELYFGHSRKDLYYEFIDKYNYSEEEITWHLARKGIEFQGIENILFAFQDYILDHMYEYGNYSYEDGDYEFIESKKSATKSIKESKYIRENDEFKESLDIDKFTNLFLDIFGLIFVFSQRKNIRKALGYKENESIIKTLIMNIKKAVEEMNDDSRIN